MQVGVPASGTGAPLAECPTRTAKLVNRTRWAYGWNLDAPCCHTQHVDMKKAAVTRVARGLLRQRLWDANPVCRSTLLV